MKESILQNLNLNFCLIYKLLLSLYYFQSNILFLFMIKYFIHFSERTPTKIRNNFIFVCNRISYHYFWISFLICEISFVVNSSVSYKKDFIICRLFFLKRCQLFLATSSCFFKLIRIVFLWSWVKNGVFSLSHPYDVLSWRLL